jgi:hypothetical protein
MEDERGSERRPRPRWLSVSLVLEWILLTLGLVFLFLLLPAAQRPWPLFLLLASLVLIGVLDVHCWRMLRWALLVRAGIAALCAVTGLYLASRDSYVWLNAVPAFQQAAHGFVCFQAWWWWDSLPRREPA